MKLFRTTRAASAADTTEASARLTAIVDRGHSQTSVYPNFDGGPAPAEVRRRFR